jgi:hypothetical protein
MGGRRERLVAAEEPLDHLTGGGVDWFQGQLPRPAPLLEHDHTVGGERQAPHEGDVGVEQGRGVHRLLLSSGRGRCQQLVGQWPKRPAEPAPAVIQPAPHGAEGEIEQLGQLVVAVALQVEADDRLAGGGRQFLEGGQDRLVDLAAGPGVLRGGTGLAAGQPSATWGGRPSSVSRYRRRSAIRAWLAAIACSQAPNRAGSASRARPRKAWTAASWATSSASGPGPSSRRHSPSTLCCQRASSGRTVAWRLRRQILRAPLLSALVRQRLRPLVSKERRADLLVLKELIEAGKVTPVIDRTYPLSEVSQAIRYLEQGHARGKVVITV